MKLFTVVILFLFTTPLAISAQNTWQLKLDKEGIKVYTKYTEHSKFKAVKTVCTFDASLSALTAALLDVNKTTDWVYATKSCSLLKTISPSEVIYHSEISVPWPYDNRDFIVKIKAVQDAYSKVVTIGSENQPFYQTENKNVVRIQYSTSRWTLTPTGVGKVTAEFELQTDPGGNIPAWLVNLFATKGPFESFKKLKDQVKKPVYRFTYLPFIKN